MSKASAIWVHKKTNGLYTVLFTATRENDLVDCVVYKALGDGSIWIRPYEEFYDGHFKRLTQEQVSKFRPELTHCQ